jgi:O-antigen/teichoic acid export membrane protein
MFLGGRVTDADPVEYGLRHHLLYLVGRAVPAAIGLVALIAYSHIFDAATYGEYAVIMGIANIVIGSALVWIRITMTRFAAAGGEHSYRMVGVALALQAGASLAIALLSLIVSLISGSSVAVFAALAALALSWSDLNLDLLRAKHQVRGFSLQYFVRQLLTVGGVLGAAALHLPVNALIFGLIAANVLSCLTLIGQLRGRSASLRFQLADVRKFAGYGLPLAVNYVVASLTVSMDRLLIAWLLGREAAGAYALAADMAWQILSVVMDGVTLAFLPYASRTLDERGHEAASKVLRQNLLILLGVALPASLGFAACGPALATLVLGQHFGATAALLIPVLAVANLIRGVRIYFLENVFQLAHRSLTAAAMTSVAAVLLAALLVPLALSHGVVGGAAALLISAAAALVVGLVLARPLLHGGYPWADVARIAVASLCSTGVALVVLIAWPDPISVVLAIPLGVLAYAAAIFVANPADARRQLSAAWQRLRRGADKRAI